MDKAITIPAYIAVPLVAIYLGAHALSYETVTLTVVDKNSVFQQENPPHKGYTPHNWLIYTEGEVYRVGIDWMSGNYRSAERYQALEVGDTYRVRVAGWRVPEFNWYRNIIAIEEPAPAEDS